MQDPVAISILPYALILGISATVLSSIFLIANGFRKRVTDKGVFERLSKIETEIKKDASQIEHQLLRAGRIQPDRAHSVISDLSVIAVDLQRQTQAVQSILDDLREANVKEGSVEAAKKIANIDIGIGEAGSRVQSLLKRLESEKQLMSDVQPANAIGQS